MNFLKVLLLSSAFLFTNCSLINDKFISKNKKNNKKEQEQIEIAKDTKNKSEEKELVLERVYIEDENKEKNVSSEDGLSGDNNYQDNNEYPNLANVPDRPDPSISIEEQKDIIKKLEKNEVSQLEPVPSKPVFEEQVEYSKVDDSNSKENRKNRSRSFSDTNVSIRDILNSKLDEIESFKPKKGAVTNQHTTEQEEELHSLARSLKDIKTTEEVKKVEDKIKKNDLYYTPDDIDKILGLKKKQVNIQLETKNTPQVAEVKQEPKKQNDTKATTVIEKKSLGDREVPVARVTFNHGSSMLSDEDLAKIRKVADLFYKNDGKKIVIVGHASSRTNYDMDLTKHALVNFNISLERARKVMRQFSSIGLNSQRIELVAMSDASPLYAEIMPSLEAANRRAEIFIQY